MTKEAFKRFWIEKILNEASEKHFDDITLLIDGQFLTQDRTPEEVKRFLIDKIIDSTDYSINRDCFIFRKPEKELLSLYKQTFGLNLNAVLVSKANFPKYEEMRIYF